ncbi:MAG: hypothetical protein A2Z21_03640 [Candidatus Fraserbacteria bacterium RBG_16_55_9]|uniref:YncE family protein n=1 Tax=Fraserbacteria sp. (strain RBG_16_55_9) TaxID=1817864 RepID=A0A1F5UZM4_FRAXR|nr:MAG: hypothetical protein A2Z21_03640 [Candidatus Fraserbacteria bacterium RBG_16_55_9]
MKITRVTRWLVILVAVAGLFVSGPGYYAAQQGTISPSTFVYVTSGNVATSIDSTLSVIRSSDDTVISRIGLGGLPLSLAVMPNGAKVYMGVYSRGVLVLQTSDNTIKARVGGDPLVLGATPDNSKVLAINVQEDTVSVIETSDDVIMDSCLFVIEVICAT